METIDVVVGRLGKPHGLKGELTVDVRTDEPEHRFAVGAVLEVEKPRDSTTTFRTLTVARTRWHQGVLLATFEEIGDRNEAEAVRGIVLHAQLRVDATPADPDEYYDHQLVGLDVVDLEGAPLGVVTTVVHGGSQDLLGIRALDGRDTLVPFVAVLVPEVDLEARRVVVADRPGLVAPLPEDA
ncbi:Ribosome maturation factor RimM [Nocardioides dokdonensis FR1436]|uniref:Ribosome maturation factor RimM n=1 Tax=Nocardioides dokdonensis FR1436 TaxID=1300347 RepID=A0A1A9GLH8_9ACTN|nr:ribosome maturation factor RimM [Nocardioides dokdonensis]ANH38946.1 Ribosome maturation factor RimM [Nocardioides dokdonensis FR1436]